MFTYSCEPSRNRADLTTLCRSLESCARLICNGNTYLKWKKLSPLTITTIYTSYGRKIALKLDRWTDKNRKRGNERLEKLEVTASRWEGTRGDGDETYIEKSNRGKLFCRRSEGVNVWMDTKMEHTFKEWARLSQTCEQPLPQNY